MKLGKPIKYISVNPSEVIDRVKKKIVEDSERQTKQIENLKDSELLTELETLHNKGIDTVEPQDLSGAVKGRDSVYTQLNSMIKTAQKEVYIITTEDGLVRKANNLRNSLVKAKKRGVKVKIAAPISKKNKQAVSDLKSIADVRTLTTEMPRCLIIDNSQAVMMVLEDNVHPSIDFGIWVKEEGFAKSLRSLFTHAWGQAKA